MYRIGAILAFVAMVTVRSADAYASGAPISECIDMTPEHYVDPQTTAFPYEMVVGNSGGGIYTGTYV